MRTLHEIAADFEALHAESREYYEVNVEPILRKCQTIKDCANLVGDLSKSCAYPDGKIIEIPTEIRMPILIKQSILKE